MRSMVEGFFGLSKAPPPCFAWSPSPANAGEELGDRSGALKRPAEAAHPVEMLLGEPEVAARGMDVRAAPGLVDLGYRPTRMVADLVVHPGKLSQSP